MKLADRILVALFSLFAFAAWCITAIVTWHGNLPAALISVGISAGLTFAAYTSWRAGHST